MSSSTPSSTPTGTAASNIRSAISSNSSLSRSKGSSSLAPTVPSESEEPRDDSRPSPNAAAAQSSNALLWLNSLMRSRAVTWAERWRAPRAGATNSSPTASTIMSVNLGASIAMTYTMGLKRHRVRESRHNRRASS